MEHPLDRGLLVLFIFFSFAFFNDPEPKNIFLFYLLTFDAVAFCMAPLFRTSK